MHTHHAKFDNLVVDTTLEPLGQGPGKLPTESRSPTPDSQFCDQEDKWEDAIGFIEEAEYHDRRGNYTAAYDFFRAAAEVLEQYWQAERDHATKKEGRKRWLDTKEILAELEKAITPGPTDIGGRAGRPLIDHGKVVEMRLEAGKLLPDDSPSQLKLYSPPAPTSGMMLPPFSPLRLLERRETRSKPRTTPFTRTSSPLAPKFRSPSPEPGSQTPVQPIEDTDITSISAHRSPTPSQSRIETPSLSRAMTPIEHLRELTPDNPLWGKSAYVPDTTDDPRTLKSRGEQDPNHRTCHAYEKGHLYHNREQSAEKDLIKRTNDKDILEKGDRSWSKEFYWDATGSYNGQIAIEKWGEIAMLKHYLINGRTASIDPVRGQDPGVGFQEFDDEGSSEYEPYDGWRQEQETALAALDRDIVRTVLVQESTSTLHTLRREPRVSMVEDVNRTDGQSEPAQQPTSPPQHQLLLSAVDESAIDDKAVSFGGSSSPKGKRKCDVCGQDKDANTGTPCYPCQRCSRAWFCRWMCQTMTKQDYIRPCSPTTEGHHAVNESETHEKGQDDAKEQSGREAQDPGKDEYLANLNKMLKGTSSSSQTGPPSNAHVPTQLSEKAKGKRKMTESSETEMPPTSKASKWTAAREASLKQHQIALEKAQAEKRHAEAQTRMQGVLGPSNDEQQVSEDDEDDEDLLGQTDMELFGDTGSNNMLPPFKVTPQRTVRASGHRGPTSQEQFDRDIELGTAASLDTAKQTPPGSHTEQSDAAMQGSASNVDQSDDEDDSQDDDDDDEDDEELVSQTDLKQRERTTHASDPRGPTSQEQFERDVDLAIAASLQPTKQTPSGSQTEQSNASLQGLAPNVDQSDNEHEERLTRPKDTVQILQQIGKDPTQTLQEKENSDVAAAMALSLETLLQTPLKPQREPSDPPLQNPAPQASSNVPRMVQGPQVGEIGVHGARVTKDRMRTLEYLVILQAQGTPRWVEGTDCIISGPQWTNALTNFWSNNPREKLRKLLVCPEQHAYRVAARPYWYQIPPSTYCRSVVGFSFTGGFRSFDYHIHEFLKMYDCAGKADRRDPYILGPDWNEAIAAYWWRINQTIKRRCDVKSLRESDKGREAQALEIQLMKSVFCKSLRSGKDAPTSKQGEATEKGKRKDSKEDDELCVVM